MRKCKKEIEASTFKLPKITITKVPRPKSAFIIDCDTWRVIGPATKEDNREAKLRIIERIKNAFWL